MMSSDSAITPYGGGAWGSRGMAIAGEAALRAAVTLRTNILSLAGAITQTDPAHLDIIDGRVVDSRTGLETVSLADAGQIGYFRQDTLPPGFSVELSVTRSFVPNEAIYYTANGVQGAHVEIDPDTGFVRLLGHWAVDDCGRVINPLLVDEQVRGGIVQGIGAALFEQCLYSEEGQLQNGTMADYLAPMAAEMPDIVVGHVETPEATTALGAKGVGEAGLIGGIGVMWSAVNDGLRLLGARIDHQPFTPERILEAIRAARRS
jgi:carbon-monoxide dehydrogenase large subunit